MPDLFISHASEDKDAFVRPLADALVARGFSVWYDEYTLRLGDSLSREIDRGLTECRFGVVVLSPHFFAKEWPRRELDGLLARESLERAKRVLPIWHDLDAADIAKLSPTLAGRLATKSANGLAAVVAAIAHAVESPNAPTPPERSAAPSAPTGNINVPPGYERQLNAHRFRILKNEAARSPNGGYAYPVEVRGVKENVQQFVRAAMENGASSVGSVTAGILTTVTFQYVGSNAPEVFESLALSAGIQVLRCEPLSAAARVLAGHETQGAGELRRPLEATPVHTLRREHHRRVQGDPADALQLPHHRGEGGQLGQPLDLPIQRLASLPLAQEPRMKLAIDESILWRERRPVGRQVLQVRRAPGGALPKTNPRVARNFRMSCRDVRLSRWTVSRAGCPASQGDRLHRTTSRTHSSASRGIRTATSSPAR